MKTPKIWGYHWQYDGWSIAPERLGDAGNLLLFCKRLMVLLGMEPLGSASVDTVTEESKTWGPGVTILQSITDSHIAIQTCQDAGKVFIDVFSCKFLDRITLRQYAWGFFMGLGKDRLIKRGR